MRPLTTWTKDFLKARFAWKFVQRFRSRKADGEKGQAKPDRVVTARNHGLLPSRRESFLMLLVTGLYLMFEVGFSARLLDVVGTTVRLEEIKAIEDAGRIISGIALTLFIWAKVVLPRFRRHDPSLMARGFFLVTSLMGCCILSYWFQEGILHGITKLSSAEQRRAAATLSLLATSVRNDDVELAGLSFDNVRKDSPEAKAFLALFPALALAVNNLEERTNTELEKILVKRAEHELGEFEGFNNDIYLDLNASMKKAFNTYLEISDQYLDARADLRNAQDSAYKDYRRGLGRFTPNSLPRRFYDRVRSDLNAGGVPVPDDWDPRDKGGFYKAIEDERLPGIQSAYSDAMQSAFGFTLRPDLGAEDFFLQDDVQKMWRDKLGIDDPKIRYIRDLEPEDVKVRIFRPLVDSIVARELATYLSPVSAFAPGGEKYEKGVDAIQVAYVPFIALIFSLAGAAVHSIKTTVFLIATVIGYRNAIGKTVVRASAYAVTASFLVGMVLLASRDNDVTRSVLFNKLSEISEARYGMLPLAGCINAVINLQVHAWPIGNGLRHGLFGGITYDFSDFPKRLYEKQA